MPSPTDRRVWRSVRNPVTCITCLSTVVLPPTAAPQPGPAQRSETPSDAVANRAPCPRCSPQALSPWCGALRRSSQPPGSSNRDNLAVGTGVAPPRPYDLAARRSCCPAPKTGRACRCECHQEGVDDHCTLWLGLSFSVLGQGHLASGDHNQTGHRQRPTGDEHTQPEKAERDRRLHR
jgi:hypothetical protein